MAHLNVSLDFDSASETATGNGWRVIHWLDDGSGTPAVQITDFYATITAAQGAIEELFSSDPEVDQYFQAKATAALVGASSSTIATNKSALRVADGLDATV
jgi:hypothetical protein